MPVQFNKQNTVHRRQALDGAGDVNARRIDAKKVVEDHEVNRTAGLEPQLATSDIKAVVGDADHDSRPSRRSAGSRSAVAGLSQATPKPKKGKSLWQKAVTAAMIGVVALSLVGCGDSSTNDPGPPGGGVRVEQQYDGGDSANPLQGRPARGSPMQIQMDNMSGGGRDVRTDDGAGTVPPPVQQAPSQNVHPDADRGPTPGSETVRGEIERRVDVEVRTGYVNQDKQVQLGRGTTRIQQQQVGDSVDVHQGMTDAERLELENSGGRQVRTRDVQTRDVQPDDGGRQVRTRDVQSRNVRSSGGGVTFHNNGGSR